MIDTLKYYRLITLQEAYDDWCTYMRRCVGQTDFGQYCKDFQLVGYKII